MACVFAFYSPTIGLGREFVKAGRAKVARWSDGGLCAPGRLRGEGVGFDPILTRRRKKQVIVPEIMKSRAAIRMMLCQPRFEWRVIEGRHLRSVPHFAGISQICRCRCDPDQITRELKQTATTLSLACQARCPAKSDSVPLGKQEVPHFPLRLVKLRFRVADGTVQQVGDFVMLVALNFMKAKDFSAPGRQLLDGSAE